MWSSIETKAMQVGVKGDGDPPFSPSTFPPQYGCCFGGMEEVEACLQSRSGFEARRNVLLNCKSQPWPVAAPILCPGGGPEGVGHSQGCEVSFRFTYKDTNAQRDQMIKNKNHTVTYLLSKTRMHVSNATCVQYFCLGSSQFAWQC